MSKFFEDEASDLRPGETRRDQRKARKEASLRDRSKFKKTDKGKREKNLQGEAERKRSKKTLLRGRVLSIQPEEISVDHEGTLYSCSLRGALKKEFSHLKNLVCVGDFVLFEIEKELSGALVHVEERTSLLTRQEHLRRRQAQLIAANIDQVLITVSVMDPTLKPSLVDRYIIATCKGNMDPIIVINKMDKITPGSEEDDLIQIFTQTYRKLGVPVLLLSAETGEGMEELKKVMQNKASVFSGQSGVGKSSLINNICQLDLLVGDVVHKTRKGAHTTTAAKLIPLEFGGWCIDTPGIRSFGIWDLKKEDLDDYFPEIAEIGAQCKYPNCTHTHEPDCALEKALEEGIISPLRFESYLRLLEEIT